MDLKQLERFVAVAEEGAFNKAAKRLFSSQPVLTRSVQLLEESLDLQLLERGHGGVRLTDHGRQLLPWARQLLNDQAARYSRAYSVAIGATSSFVGRIIPRAITEIVDRYPGAEIRVVEGNFPTILDRLRQGELDMAFGTKAESTDMEGLSFEPLLKEKFEVITGAGHKALSLKKVTLRDLASERWIVPDDPETVRAWVRVFSGSRLATPSLVVKTSSHTLIGRLLEEGGFLALVGSVSFDHELASGALKVVPLSATGILRPAGLFSRIDREATPNALIFAKSLRKASADWASLTPV
jgi:DNA-binding transcriptional LysR family regulator